MIKSSRKSPNADGIYLPGEIEYIKLDQNLRSGIEVSDAISAQLCEYSCKVKLISQGDTLEKLIAIAE